MAAIISRKAGAVAPTMPVVSAAKTVAVIAGELPPTLREGQTIKSWLKDTAEFVGAHPEPVLVDACEAIRSTRSFSPSKAEIVQAVLDAYLRLGVTLSPDAMRHAAYRKKLPARYAISAAGTKRFADDAHVLTVGFVKLFGPQANLLLEEVDGATVEDAEKAVIATHRAFADSDRPNGDDVITRFREEIGVQIAYRLNGTPAGLCGGTVASLACRSGTIRLESRWLALSEFFVGRMRDIYPYARTRADLHLWSEAMREAFYDVASRLGSGLYGNGLQVEAEAMIERRLADMHRFGSGEVLTRRRFEQRELATVSRQIEVAEMKIKAGTVVMSHVEIDGRSCPLSTEAECDVARRLVQSAQRRVSAEIAEMTK